VEIEAVQKAAEDVACQLLRLHDEAVHNTGNVRLTSSNLSKATIQRTKLRGLIAAWVAWTMFMQPEGEEPPTVVEEDWLSGRFPWSPGGLGIWEAAIIQSQDALQLALYKAEQELLRSKEELEYLPADAAFLLNNIRSQQLLIVRHLGLNGSSMPAGLRFFFTRKLDVLHTLYTKAQSALARASLVPTTA
jgi:hypothetical protein